MISLHFLGFALTLQFYDYKYFEKLDVGGIPRRPPNLDKEIIPCMMEPFEKVAQSEEERKLREKFTTFYIKNKLYSLEQRKLM